MKPRIKPRNPLVATAKFRKAGSHEKPFKTQRRADKVALFKVAKHDPKGDVSKLESQPKPLTLRSFGGDSGFQPASTNL
jgi:hypothetical protein